MNAIETIKMENYAVEETRTTIKEENTDLIELLISIWGEKRTIFSSMLIMFASAAIYLAITPKIYEASIQLEPLKASSLMSLNNTGFFDLTEEESLYKLIKTLTSNTHKVKLIEKNKKLLAEQLNLPQEQINADSFELEKIYSITYLEEIKNNTSTRAPQTAKISAQGKNRTLLKKLLLKNIEIASQTIMDEYRKEHESLKAERLLKLKNDFISLSSEAEKKIENKIIRISEEIELKKKKLTDKLNSRKSLLLKNRNSKIIVLEEALKIATNLNLENPSSFTQLSTPEKQAETGKIEVKTEIMNQEEPLYLRGKRLLSQEINSLKERPENKFTDEELNKIEAEIAQLSKNHEIDVLLARKNEVPFNNELEKLQLQIQKLENSEFPKRFFISLPYSIPIAPTKPVKPRPQLILTFSLAAGILIGLLLALIKSAYKQYKIR